LGATQKFAVIGLGRFGSRLATVLAENGAEVIAIDRDPDLVETIRDSVTLAVRLDATNEDALRAQGVDRVDAAIVGIGEDFESSALTVATLKGLGVPQIFARARTEIQAKILSEVGADAIVSPERESALRWAHRLMLPNLEQYVELGEGHSLIYTAVPTAFCHKSLLELHLRKRYGVNLVAIKRPAGKALAAPAEGEPSPPAPSIIAVPTADTTLLPGDVLILVGSNEALSRLPAD
jgi:trk system potassium uptake protein TrkA